MVGIAWLVGIALGISALGTTALGGDVCSCGAVHSHGVPGHRPFHGEGAAVSPDSGGMLSASPFDQTVCHCQTPFHGDPCDPWRPLCDDLGATTLFQWSEVPPSFQVSADKSLIRTERPSFTPDTTTVGQNRFQLETGYTFSRRKHGSRVHSFPESLARWGVFAEWFELRLGFNYINAKERVPGVGRRSQKGPEDLYLAAKLALTDQVGLLPEMAIIPQLQVPLGSGPFTNSNGQPGLVWVYGWDVNPIVRLSGSSHFNRRQDSIGHSYAEYAQSMMATAYLSDQISSYLEYYFLSPTGARAGDTSAEHYLNVGFQYLVTSDVQVDWRVGSGLNSSADNFFTGFGLSFRF